MKKLPVHFLALRVRMMCAASAMMSALRHVRSISLPAMNYHADVHSHAASVTVLSRTGGAAINSIMTAYLDRSSGDASSWPQRVHGDAFVYNPTQQARKSESIIHSMRFDSRCGSLE